MQAILIVGIILVVGLVFGMIASALRLPKVTGYIIAGILLNPDLLPIVPRDIPASTHFVINVALSFITFCIGGTLVYKQLKALGKSIIAITLFEAETTFLVVAVGFALTLPFIIHEPRATMLATFIPVGLLLGALASPTDPTGTLAVVHQYRAKGDLTSTILSVSAFDDALGLINFSLATAVAQVLVMHEAFNFYNTLVTPLIVIVGAVLLGVVFGFVFNVISHWIRKETGGVLIVLTIGMLCVCYGVADLLKLDALLGTMAMGIIVANYNPHCEKIFHILERYTEEMIFVLFFTVSGMFLDFSVMATAAVVVLLYTIFRTIGKFGGTFIGASITRTPKPVKRYTAYGLLPSGGIIVGLALTLQQTPAFSHFADIIISVIIGATVIHEIAGPIFVKFALRRTGEIPKR